MKRRHRILVADLLCFTVEWKDHGSYSAEDQSADGLERTTFRGVSGASQREEEINTDACHIWMVIWMVYSPIPL
jgi:hypothetical protein